jgi:hypothetical protein
MEVSVGEEESAQGRKHDGDPLAVKQVRQDEEAHQAFEEAKEASRSLVCFHHLSGLSA